MTVKDAADYLRPIMNSASLSHYRQALKLALECLDKQTQKKAIVIGVHYWCAGCGALLASSFERWKPDYCSMCGQAACYPDEEEGEKENAKCKSNHANRVGPECGPEARDVKF